MKKTFVFFLSTALAFSMPGAGFAQEYRVEIPKTELQVQAQSSSKSISKPMLIELGASSWTPNHFALPARTASDQEFSRAGLPAFYGNFLIPLEHVDGFSDCIGINWIPLNRKGSIGSDDSTTVRDQTVQLVSIRLGAEYSPESWSIHTLHPYIGAALFPSFAATGRSAFDDGTVYFGIPLEMNLGTSLPLRTISSDWKNAALDLGMNGTVGSINHSSVAGFGVRAGMRMSL